MNVDKINTDTTTQKRLRILGEDEIEFLFGMPHFTQEERVEYFLLSALEKSALEEFQSFKSKIYFILQLGYFKAKHFFLSFGFQEVQEDVTYIKEQYFPNFQGSELGISKITRLKQQQTILKLCKYVSCDKQQRQYLKTKARHLAVLSTKPIYIFRELINYLEQNRITIPAYSFMQDIIGQALTYEQTRLVTITHHYLKACDVKALKSLLEDSSGLYEITLLKHEAKNFSTGEIKREIFRGQKLSYLYKLAQLVLPNLNISNESIKHYASLVLFYSVQRLKQLNEWVVYVYLLCFIHHRYRRLHDNLINCLIYKVREYHDKAKGVAKEKAYEHMIENNQNLQKAGYVLKLFTDNTIEENTPFHQVQAKAFNILERQKLDSVAQHISKTTPVDETAFQWSHVDKLAKEFKLNLRPILQNVEFSAISEHSSLIKAINFLKLAFESKKPLSHYSSDSFPLRFAPKSIKRYLYGQNSSNQKYIIANRYEFLVYRFLRYALESKDVFCRDSVHFRSFESELITDSQFQQKDKLIAETGLTILNQPIKEHLLYLEQKLEARLALVNERISSKENSHFHIKKTGSHIHWTLQYPQNTESVNHSFFDLLEQINVADVILFVHQQTHFLAVFDHILGRYNKQNLEPHIVIACFVAWATNTGLGKMSEISDITFQELSSTSDNFIRLETLRDANDLISNYTSKLSIFHYYDIGNTLHSSSDGQKFETQTDTINSRYSPKYFGLKKGIVSYSLVLNHVPINSKVIGANEHESASLFDIIHNNTTDIDPEIHSTDTHGSNQVNFAILHLFGYQFAPRYKDIYHKLNESLYGFKHPSLYPSDWIIKPIRKTLTDLIVDEWENIQRIFLSLALKTTTQSIIVSKLSSHSRKNKTQRALWEYDNIIRSLYLLDYIDSPSLRQNVHKALNRGENYHQLRRAISHANFGKLRFKTEYEQNLWNECSRLIANCIIYYNAFILSNLLIYKENIGDDKAISLLKQISPVAWQHINLHGRYQFNVQTNLFDMDSIIQKLTSLPIELFS